MKRKTTNKKQNKKIFCKNVSTSIEPNTIENKADKKLFSKKKVILMVLFAIVSIIVAYLTVRFILNINWTSLFSSISDGFSRNIGFAWFTLLILFFVLSIYKEFGITRIRLSKLGYKISRAQYWLLGFSTAFFRSVTPGFLGDSYCLIWMRSNGVPTYRVTSILFTHTLLWQIVQLVVTFPSFIAIIIYRGAILATPEGITVFIFLCIGIGIDVITIAFVFLMCISRRVHYFLSSVFNWFKKKLHMKYHTKEQIALKYKSNAVIKRDFFEYMKDWKTTLLIVLVLALAEVVTYMAIGWSMYFVQYVKIGSSFPYSTYKVNFDYWWAFNCANVTFTANRLNFLIPNGEGSLEYIIRIYLTAYADFSAKGISNMGSDRGKELIKNITDNSILIWRTFGAFIPAITGIFGLGAWIGIESNKVKHGNKFFVEEK